MHKRAVEEVIGDVDLKKWRVLKVRVDEDGKSRLWLAPRKDEINWEEVLKKTIAQMKAWSPSKRKFRKQLSPSKRRERTMLELDVFDVHLGVRSWAIETGVNEDVEISSEKFLDTIDHLLSLSKPFPAKVVLFPVGNDFLHIDNVENTTKRGTSVDVDTRITKIFERGKLLLVEAISRILDVAEKVIVPVIPGNHDETSMFFLGHVLAAWFRNSGRVTVDFSPRPRKYFRWGQGLIGFTHGSEEKLERLPMVMAEEAKRDWSQTKFHVWKIGHLHHPRKFLLPVAGSVEGVVIEQCGALVSRDAWHTRKGYVFQLPEASATVWDLEQGPIAKFFHRVV